MNTFTPSVVAVVGQPLFGNQWLALLAVLGVIAVFLFAVAALGRWLAATHPDTTPARRNTTADVPVSTSDVAPEVMAAIAAAVAATMGKHARIAAVQPKPATVSVEALMQQWSLEGRRQIYTSHKIR